MKSKSNLTLRALCEGAIFVALAVVLSLLPVYKMPWGGSFDLAMADIYLLRALGLRPCHAGKHGLRHFADAA